MSPFDHNLLDIRMAGSYSESFQVSLVEEFYLYRVIFLVLGILMMALASWLSESLIFYYSGAMAVGVFLVALMVLFQGMKLLPTGRKSSFAIFLYSCFVELGTFFLQYVPRLFRSLLIDVGLSEDIYDPMVLFLFVFITIVGAWLGYWVVLKFVLTEDGSVDIGVNLGYSDCFLCDDSSEFCGSFVSSRGIDVWNLNLLGFENFDIPKSHSSFPEP